MRTFVSAIEVDYLAMERVFPSDVIFFIAVVVSVVNSLARIRQHPKFDITFIIRQICEVRQQREKTQNKIQEANV